SFTDEYHFYFRVGISPGQYRCQPKGKLKAITTRSGLVTDGPTVSNPPKSVTPEEDECVEETYTNPDLAEYTIKVPPPPCLAAGGNTFPEFRDNIQGYVLVAAGNYNQGNPGYRPQGVANQMRPPGAARRWLKKEPPHSITTWDDLLSKFINEFFPPSRTTNLRNEISNCQQKFDESFHEAWERYKDLLRACPHHSFTELHQLDTFYNALNPADQDSLNAAARGNLLEKSPQDALTIIENKSKQTSAVTTAMTATLKQLQANPPTARVKAVEEIRVTCGGAHPYYQCLA
nr:reverse transcriptase domain-containing protein [Tanacetum cinerariifolium]